MYGFATISTIYVSTTGFPSGIIRKTWNDTENISMAPAQGWHSHIEKCKQFSTIYVSTIHKINDCSAARSAYPSNRVIIVFVSGDILRCRSLNWLFYIPQRGVQWKQGVVIYMTLYTSLLYNTTPIHCTPDPLHPPLQSIQLLDHPMHTLWLILQAVFEAPETRRKRGRNVAARQFFQIVDASKMKQSSCNRLTV